MVQALDIIYKPSDSIIAQGKDVRKLKEDGYYCYQGGHDTYRMNKPSTAILKFKSDGVIHSCSVKSLIREVYGISNVTEKQAYQFFDDVSSGKIILDYSEEHKLFLIK